MNVYVVGVALHRTAALLHERRLEEIANATAPAALDDAGCVAKTSTTSRSRPATSSTDDRFRAGCLPHPPALT